MSVCGGSGHSLILAVGSKNKSEVYLSCIDTPRSLDPLNQVESIRHCDRQLSLLQLSNSSNAGLTPVSLALSVGLVRCISAYGNRCALVSDGDDPAVSWSISHIWFNFDYGHSFLS